MAKDALMLLRPRPGSRPNRASRPAPLAGVTLCRALSLERPLKVNGALGIIRYGRVCGWRAMHAISLGHLDSRPSWLGLEPGRKQPLPLGSLFCKLKL